MMKPSRTHKATVIALMGVTLLSIAHSTQAQTLSLKQLGADTHFHGIAVDARDASRIYLATHHGVFVVGPQGQATRLSENTNDYMGFTPHPTDPTVLYASGHPAGGGNLGFIVSRDGGRSWRQLSTGVNGPVDFHQMDVSKADPLVVYGNYAGLQVSRDGGKSWKLGAPLPAGVIDLAASAVDVSRIYAATKGGLLYSTDAGATWEAAHLKQSPATLVQTGYAGEVYAFILGLGLLRTQEQELRWEVVSDSFGERFVLHLAVDPEDPKCLYVVTKDKEVLASKDGGTTWTALGDPGGD